MFKAGEFTTTSPLAPEVDPVCSVTFPVAPAELEFPEAIVTFPVDPEYELPENS
jgi:hypothetical protein